MWRSLESHRIAFVPKQKVSGRILVLIEQAAASWVLLVRMNGFTKLACGVVTGNRTTTTMLSDQQKP